MAEAIRAVVDTEEVEAVEEAVTEEGEIGLILVNYAACNLTIKVYNRRI